MCHFDLIEKEETRVREGVLGMNNEKNCSVGDVRS